MSSFNGDSFGDFKGFRISQPDDDDEIEAQPMNIDEDEDEDEDEYEEEESEEDDKDCELGFIKKPKFTWSSLRQVFPKLAGGVPAWLDPVNLPSGKTILCDFCEEPLQFLLQIYAPIKDKESTVHRMLFLFMCPSMSCLLRDQDEQCKCAPKKAMRSIKVFRCQLPRVNPFYSSESPKDDGTDKPLGHGAPLCTWCGTWKGDKLCSGCKNARYCSPKHQSLHWRSGHQTECQQHHAGIETSLKNEASLTEKPKVASKSLWKEFELITEKELESSDDTKMTHTSEHVIRYCLSSGGRPRWLETTGRISESEIPNCKSCGGPLCFEFQVMPQLLYFFGVQNERDSLDWATIVVYTCEKSCESSLSYKEEFVWVQLYNQTNLMK